MADMRWTENQRDAITARKGSVLVSAAAGSGKTAVLVQRVIETITDSKNPVPIDRMLIVTFTRAAREEMLTRVEKAITQLLRQQPDNAALREQKQRLYNAKINTIDGFCTEFVRQFFYKLDIQQDFRIADEKELTLIKNQAMDNALEYFYNENSKEFLALVDAVCTYRNDNRLRNNIFKLYNFLVTIPFMDSWMNSKLKYYNTDETPVEKSPHIRYILSYISSCLTYCLQLVSGGLDMLEADEILTKANRDKLLDVLKEDSNAIKAILTETQKGNWDSARDLYTSLKWKTFPRFKDETGVKEHIKFIRDNYKAEVKSGCELLFESMEDIKEDTKNLFPLISAFFDCVKKFDEEFKSLKKEKNLLDFSDIENNMIKLLCCETEDGIAYTDTAKEISEMFDCIMVDEFQDINEVQNLIFKAISKDENNLFMVGDVKQSIYGFRQANPEIFISYKEKYNLYNRDKENYPAKIILDKNFRSRECVLNACNFVFDKLMSPEVGGITYNEEELLNCGASYIPNDKACTEVMLIDTSQASEDNDDTKVKIEAKAVASKINDILYKENYMVQDSDGLRPVQPGDIAILLRTSKGMGRKAAIYVEVLNQFGLMAVASEKQSIFDSTEIKILLNFLRIIDNPVQDIPLLSVLMSPIFGFTADDLAEIRANYPKVPLYTAVLKSRSNSVKCDRFLETLSTLRTASVTTSVDKLIGIILEMTGFDSIVMAMNGDTAKNIFLLQKYAREYSDNGYVTLSAFIKFIDNVIEKGMVLDGSVSTDGDILNAVRVMSIHASKGLEFPVCFICDTNTRFNNKDTTEDMVIDAKTGIGIRYKDDFIKYDTIQRKAVALMLKNSLISEELRILYVAMTRAKERLIITSGHKAPDDYLCSIAGKLTEEKLPPYVVSNFRSFSDWIIACGLLHPSGEIWRKKADCKIGIFENGKLIPWNFSIINSDSTETAVEKSTEKEVIEPEPADIEFLENLLTKINCQYNYEPLINLPQKVSASELSHKDNKIFAKVLEAPSFLSEKKATGTDIGTAFHTFMEFCDLNTARKDLNSEIQSLKIAGFLSENQCNLIDREKTNAFINSPLITRVLNSDEYYREFKFTVKIKSSEYNAEISSDFADKEIVMQGAVDLVFIENKKAVIIDYKTDKVKDINSLKEIYQKQLELYKSAIEQSLELPVNEVNIYSLHLNEQLNIPL